jgi:hypothetical protein
MAGSTSARQRLAASPLTASSMARILRRTMPKRNMVDSIDYASFLALLRRVLRQALAPRARAMQMGPGKTFTQ